MTRPSEPTEDEVDPAVCPACGRVGKYEGRVMIGGRGFYTCPDRHRWQDLLEKPSNKGTPVTFPRPGIDSDNDAPDAR